MDEWTDGQMNDGQFVKMNVGWLVGCACVSTLTANAYFK